MKRIGDLIGHNYRKWEQTGKVYVFATDGVGLNDLEATIAIIKQVIDEFNLPLQTWNGNADKSEDVPLVESLITSNTVDSLIDSKSIMEELRCYWNESVLHYGLIVLVNPERHRFRNEPSDPEPAKYGWSDYEGLSVLRCFDIKNAVRHEFGHMVGLGSHHQDSAMDWHCTIHDFCSDCRTIINELWELN
jgi:hypothetical protein